MSTFIVGSYKITTDDQIGSGLPFITTHICCFPTEDYFLHEISWDCM